WAAQIEIDEHYSLAHARKGDRKVGGRGRLAFLLDCARDHDRARVYVQVDELDVRAQRAEGLRLDAVGFGHHHEPVAVAKLAPRFRYAREQRQPELLSHFLCAANTRVERFAEEGEPDAEHKSESKPEDAVPHRLRLGLDGLVRQLHRNGVSRLQGDVSIKPVAAGLQFAVRVASLATLGHHLAELIVGTRTRSYVRHGVKLRAIASECACVRLRETDCDLWLVIPGRELEQVRVGLGRGARMREELIRRPRESRERKRALRYRW